MIFACKSSSVHFNGVDVPAYILSNHMYVWEKQGITLAMTGQDKIPLEAYFRRPVFNAYPVLHAIKTIKFTSSFGSSEVLQGLHLMDFNNIAIALYNVKQNPSVLNALDDGLRQTVERWVMVAQTAHELGQAKADNKPISYN
jgi:hypothetical protein